MQHIFPNDLKYFKWCAIVIAVVVVLLILIQSAIGIWNGFFLYIRVLAEQQPNNNNYDQIKGNNLQQELE